MAGDPNSPLTGAKVFILRACVCPHRPLGVRVGSAMHIDMTSSMRNWPIHGNPWVAALLFAVDASSVPLLCVLACASSTFDCTALKGLSSRQK